MQVFFVLADHFRSVTHRTNVAKREQKLKLLAKSAMQKKTAKKYQKLSPFGKAPIGASRGGVWFGVLAPYQGESFVKSLL